MPWEQQKEPPEPRESETREKAAEPGRAAWHGLKERKKKQLWSDDEGQRAERGGGHRATQCLPCCKECGPHLGSHRVVFKHRKDQICIGRKTLLAGSVANWPKVMSGGQEGHSGGLRAKPETMVACHWLYSQGKFLLNTFLGPGKE